MVEIYEDKLEQKHSMHAWADMMTEEQRKRGSFYASEYMIRRGEIEANKPEWDDIQKLYACERDPDPSDPAYPNSFIPLLTPTVEGQVASMIESSIDYTHVTDNPAHEQYMSSLDQASAWFRRKNKTNLHMKDFSRMYDLLGNAWVTISWEKSYSKKKGVPSGYPKISVPPLQSVIVDGKIKDYKDLQSAEYIIHEVGFQSIAWARQRYGDDLAEAIMAGYNRYDGEDPQVSWDDSSTWLLLNVWTRNNEHNNLQLIEMDQNGLILFESDSSKPYYSKVDNEYPFAFARMTPKQGNFYGYGDGKILKPMQETVNRLADELELAARFSAQSKIFVDTRAKMDLDQLNSDPSKPIVCERPNEMVRVISGQGINGVVVNMIEFMLREAQRATRFHDIMTGGDIAASSTATSVNAQLMQGSVGIKDKKTDISEVMGWVDMYCLKLCLQYWDKPFWANVSGEKPQFVDMFEMNHAPAAVPTSAKTISSMIEQGIDASKLPYYELLEEGSGITETDFDFSTHVVIGQSMGRGKTDMYNLLLGLMQMQIVKPDGTTEPLISAKRAKKLMEEAIGFKLSTDDDEQEEQGQVMAAGMNPMGQGGQSPISTPPDNLASTVPGVGSMDKRFLA